MVRRLSMCVVRSILLEVYNLTNHVNFGNPSGARNSTQFLMRTVANTSRTAQIGFRLIF